MEAFRATQKNAKHGGGEVSLDGAFLDSELTALWNRMRTARSKCPAMTDAWSQADKLGRGKVRVAKRRMLWLWIHEQCQFTKHVLEEAQSLVQAESTGTKSKWLTYGRLQILVGEKAT